MPAPESFDVIIIGTGFGANVVVTELLQNHGFVNKKILARTRGMVGYPRASATRLPARQG